MFSQKYPLDAQTQSRGHTKLPASGDPSAAAKLQSAVSAGYLNPEPLPTKKTMNSSAQPEDFGAVKLVLKKFGWQYRGEGNSKIAISLLAEKKILLLSKLGRGDTINNSDFWRWMSTNIKFINSIMKPLLGEAFVSSPSLAYLSSCDIQLLNENLASVRPENRKDKELSFCGGELCDDHVFLPPNMMVFCKSKSLCVELKPKQGIFPDSERCFRNCLFCRKQQLKIKDGLVCKQSLYCPLDLFSGSHVRMKNALLSLIRSPQNNFRIFYDGDICYADNHSESDLEKVLMDWLPPVSKSNLVERFSAILLQALTKDFVCFEGSSKSSKEWIFDGPSPLDLTMESTVDTEKANSLPLPLPPCDYDRQALSEGSILHRLAQAQALDNLGTTLVNDSLKSHSEYSVVMDHNLKSSSTDYVNNILLKGCSSKLNPIERYLIAAVVRDCSILITLQEIKEDSPQVQALPQVVDEESDTHFLCRIAAVDLEPKPISCISSQMKKKACIVKACQQSLN